MTNPINSSLIRRLSLSAISWLLVSLLPVQGQSPTPGPPAVADKPAVSSVPTSAQKSSDGAAERKKRFEEDKRRLEASESNNSSAPAIPHTPTADWNQTLFVSPSIANLVVGETRRFGAFELNLNSLASRVVTDNVEWSISDTAIAELFDKSDPTIDAKSAGTTTIRARQGDRVGEATITVISAGPLPAGSVIWAVPQIQDYVTKQIVQAVPTATGPALYSIDENPQHISLLRAFTSDGLQLWSRKFAGGDSPGSFPNGAHIYAVPH